MYSTRFYLIYDYLICVLGDIREVAHYVLLSRNVNMQRIALTFMLREIFDLAHYDTSTEDFARVQAKGI